jgi:hypothetical protein
MNTQKHTQGPWRCVDTSNHAHDYRLLAANGAPLPLNVVANDHSEQRANARLIAAAPDLLAVASALVEFADGNNRINLTGKLALAVGLARAAISKAEGVK